MHYIDDPLIAYITRCQIEGFQAGHFFNHGCLFSVEEILKDYKSVTINLVPLLYKH